MKITKSELKNLIKECYEELDEAIKITPGYATKSKAGLRASQAIAGIGIVALAKKLRDKRQKIKDPEQKAKQKEKDDKKIEQLRKKKEAQRGNK